MTFQAEELFFGKLKFTAKHIKALLRNPQMRERIVGRIGKEGLVADVDDLPSSAVCSDECCFSTPPR